MGLILGLDVGVSSVGYGIIEKENNNIICAGVRLFEEATKNGNEKRRSYRSIRRQIRRKKHRLERAKNCLTKYGIPNVTIGTTPYALRKKAIHEKVTLEELSTALLHITKRRGTTLDIPQEEDSNDNELSTKEQINRNNKELENKYICEVQLERLAEGKIRNHRNKFRLTDYEKELLAILNNQKQYYPEITNDFIKEYIEIFKSKRMYYDGPGSGKSPTPYGQFFYNEKGELEHMGMIEKMRGKCTFFPDEPRIAKMSYTADLFNLLNDLNNLSFNGDKLTKEDKKTLVNKFVKKGQNLTPTRINKYISDKYNVDKNTISGYRINLKNNKEIVTEFEGYNKLIKLVKNNKLPSILYEDTELADEIIEILTTHKDITNREKYLTELLCETLPQSELKSTIEAFKEITDYKNYHSLSKAAIEVILDDLWDTNLNQMQLFTEKGFFYHKPKVNIGKQIKFDDTAILSTVARRSIREAIKVVNKIREDYGELDGIVIEMAREKNTYEKKQYYSRLHKQQDKLEKELAELLKVENLKSLKLNNNQLTALKFWKEQDGKCIYSHKPIVISDIVNKFYLFEIDHIIPLSLSFDDSLNNKVLCYNSENQNKGQRTPFEYYSSGKASIPFGEFESEVIRLYKNNKKKLANLLEKRDVRYNQELLKQFINRNLIDTRYATKSLLSTFKDYFKTNNINTKVYAINGNFTASFRRESGIKKDRDYYAHHAIDALIVASMTKVPKLSQVKNYILNNQDNVINIETGEIMAKYKYFDKKVLTFINNLSKFDNIKYSHKVDKKVNRQLFDQTIYKTRELNGEDYTINKFKDIYSLSDKKAKDLADKLRNNPKQFFIYENNKDVYNQLIKIIDSYKDANNPFAAYREEYGYILKDNKIPIKNLRYYSNKLGIHVDISHKYINPKNKIVMLHMHYLRIDIYKNINKGNYKFVAIPYTVCLPQGDKFVISQETYNKLKEEVNIDNNYKFVFSLYKNDRFKFSVKDKLGNLNENEAIFIGASDKNKQIIEIGFVDREKTEQIKKYINKFLNIIKINTDVLGNTYPIYNEKELKLTLQK